MSLIAAIGSGCGGGSLVANSGTGSSGDAYPAIEAAIDEVVADYLADNNVPGATVAVTKGSRLVMSKGYGLADLEAGTQMEPWHRTRIGSVSKVLTTVGALQLTEAGLLDLDAPLYSSAAVPLWGSNPNDKPGIAYVPDGVLDDAGSYLAALADAVKTHTPAPQPGGFLDPAAAGDLPGYLKQGSYQANVTEAIDWATDIRIGHVLTHTAGFLRSGSADKGADAFEDEEPDDLSYPQLHEAMMMGVNGHPLRFRAGTDRAYSNHGFGLMGEVIAQRAGQAYVDYMQANVFHPVGLTHVAPRDLIGVVGDLDATSYAKNDDGEPVPPSPSNTELRTEPAISTSTGGWTATAQDVVRVVCAVDGTSNHMRLLNADTAETMASVPYPQAHPEQPLGWDWLSGTPALTKGGSTPRGGGARVTKYLPGGAWTTDEINVAVNTNRQGSPPISLLRSIAKVVAAADIPDDYDLFDPAYRCRTPLAVAPLTGAGLAVNPEPPAVDALVQPPAKDSHDRPSGDVDRGEGDGDDNRGHDRRGGDDDRRSAAGQRDGQPREDDRDDAPQGDSTETRPDDSLDPGSGDDSSRDTDQDRGDRGDSGNGDGEPRDADRRPSGPIRVRIERPDDGQIFAPTSKERTVRITFAGLALEGDDTPLAPTRLRWTATTGDDEWVLCRGGDVPSPKGGARSGQEPLHAEPTCAEFTVPLPPASRSETSYLVVLEAWDSDKVLGHDERTIVVRWP